MPLQHKSPETIYRGQEAYVRIDAQAFQEHGEVKITGEPIIADEVVKKVNRNGFEITYLTYLVDLFDKLGGKKYTVFKYILAHKSAENTLIITTREPARKTETSVQTAKASGGKRVDCPQDWCHHAASEGCPSRERPQGSLLDAEVRRVRRWRADRRLERDCKAL